MIGKDSIIYSLRNLNKRKGRSFLTVFSILVGIATIFIFISFGLGLYNYTNSFTTGSSANKLLITAKGVGIPGMSDTVILNDTDLKVVQRSAGVEKASGVYYGAAKLEKGGQVKYGYLVSYDPKDPILRQVFGIGIANGRDLQKGDTGAVLGYNYMLNDKIFNKALNVNDLVTLNGHRIKVLGFMASVGNPQDDSNVYITNNRFLKIYPNKTTYAEIVAQVDINKLNWTINNIDRNLRHSRDLAKGKEDFFVQSFEDMVKSYSGALNIIVGFIVLIALISVLVSVVNTANTMITSVLERYKEIGVLKSIGARNSEILGIFLFESSFLGLIAGGLGVLLGWGLSALAGNILTSSGYGFLQPSFPPLLFGGLIVFSVLTGAISGVFPAIRASKINAVDALRYE